MLLNPPPGGPITVLFSAENHKKVAFEEPVKRVLLEGHPNRILGFSEMYAADIVRRIFVLRSPNLKKSQSQRLDIAIKLHDCNRSVPAKSQAESPANLLRMKVGIAMRMPEWQ